MKTPSIVALLTVTALSMAWGCSTVDERLGIEINAPPEQFGTPDAGPDALPDPRELVSYCPSAQCPPGWTTCPDSRFPCDTNILADDQNCGGCGLACPADGINANFTCNEGSCVMQCSESFGSKDCDGVVDNGCESGQRDPLNCGACGVACAVGQDCKWQDDAFQIVGCGCPAGTVDCGTCTDVEIDDRNCGGCNVACDPTGGENAPQYANSYYGCADSQCGRVKCQSGFIDCDGDVENGCETSILSADNCGGCGVKCASDQWCALGNQGLPVCMCELPGMTFCKTGEENGLATGYCTDLTTSRGNCGACGNVCPHVGSITEEAYCDYGKCGMHCRDGAADCNGATADGCEIDTNRDPRNCGGCGIECDLKLGQACVAGKCVVEPCDQVDAGEVTR